MKHTLFSKINTYSLLFAIVVILFLGTMRLVTLLLFGDSTDIQNNIASMDDLFLVGLKFDLRVIGIGLLLLVYLPYLLLFWVKNHSLFLSWVKISLSILLACIVFLAFIDVGYFVFFGTPIDILIFGLFEDDTQAVLESGISDPSLMLVAAIGSVAIAFAVLFFLKISQSRLQKQAVWFTPKKSWALILILPILMVAARGSVGTFPLTLKSSSISSNSFINSLTQNAVFHLKYAYSNRKENNFNKSTEQILAEAKVKDADELMRKAGFNKSNPLIQKTPSNPLLDKQPPHVVFVLMEGWSSHIALSDSASNPVLGRFKKHAEEDYFLTSFFSNRYATNPTIENILLNTPLTPLSQSSGYKTTFSQSNVLPFKHKGYQTSFISGGYSSWRNHDVFWPKQGFDEYIGRSIIEKKYNVHADNPCGVYDEYVFHYLQDELPKRKKPSFSFILTTNNHPPVKLPPEYKSPTFDVKSMGFTDNLEHHETMLAGFQYQTNALGKFLNWLKKSDLKDKVIVVATGDHPLRGFDDYTPIEKQYLRYSVPFYLYIPKQYNQLNKKPKETIEGLFGSHVDIFPTLFQLSLSNAKYYAFGTPIMNKTADNAYGWHDQKAIILKQGVITQKTSKLHPWSKQNKLLLNTHDVEPSKEQLEIIEQEKYRRWLKEWLLYKDKK